MSKDDYVSVTLGTFTFFVWALIGFMQWFGSMRRLSMPRRHKLGAIQSIDADDCGVELRAPPINCIDNAVETGTLLSAFLRLFHVERRCYRFNENGPALGSRAASNAD